MKLRPPIVVTVLKAAHDGFPVEIKVLFIGGHVKIQVNTDDNVEGREKLVRRVEAEVSRTLGHLSYHITRVEVHLSDENSGKSGRDDKRCLMEARIGGRQPVAVSNLAGSLDEAFGGAAEKMRRALERTLGRLKDHKGRVSIRGIGSSVGPQSDQPVAAPGR